MNCKGLNITIIRNVGLNKGTPRVWLEGPKLDLAGFCANVQYTKELNRETMVLTLDPEGDFKVSSKKATAKSAPEGYRMPVIDLHNSLMADWLRGAQSVTVNFQAGVITLKRIKPEEV